MSSPTDRAKRFERTREIRATVKRLLERAGIERPPVELASVARVQGVVSIEADDLGSAYGMLLDRPTGLAIRVNSRNPEKARFTLAHEIAHTLIDAKQRGTNEVLALRRPRAATSVERLCDEIAAELLLPYDMFIGVVGNKAISIEGIRRVATIFDSSLTAAAKRSGELSSGPAQVLRWEKRDGSLRVTMQSGRRYLTCEGALGARSLTDRKSPIARAFSSREAEVGVEVPMANKRWPAFRCEAQAFGTGDRRFVLAVAKPAQLT